MIVDMPEEVMPTSTSSAGNERRLRIKALKGKEKENDLSNID